MSHRFSTIQNAVKAISEGRVVIVVDDEDRENEGDFVCAAELITTEMVNFMLAGHGQLCCSILPTVAERLDLRPLVDQNTSPLTTAFMTPVDFAGCKTGITAAERAETIRRLARAETQPSDFVKPGHVYPLLAKEGGVLRRAGHTEASVDLARMAGLTPSGVVCEILNRDGDRANRDELVELAAKHQLEIISVEQIISHRRINEKLVSRTAQAKLPTKFGEFEIIVYDVQYEPQEPIALVYGKLDEPGDLPPLVRMHSSCFTGDLLASLRCDCGDQLHLAIEAIAREGRGALVYLPQEGRGIGLAQKIRAYSLQDEGLDTVEANHRLGFKADMRDYGVGIQILKDLGLREIRLLTNNPKKTEAFNLRGFDLTVVDQVPIIPPIHEHNANYLATKRDKMGHLLP
ncbi:MAG: GTP cyclohydrolase II [Planctomycetes bacterium]|jgi:3,4-dihydroxy 2-butanone 4-phosphate synthase/GTP cyclohydrolase II|nr:GTP cyclohydrolase II [Planctomycetota bacterium]